MELQRIEQGLGRLFQIEGYRIVFSHDPARELTRMLSSLDLGGPVKVDDAKFGDPLAEEKAVTPAKPN